MSVIDRPIEVEAPEVDPLEEIPVLPAEPTKKSEINKFIDKVIDVLRTHGWTKGVLENRQGEVCFVGALSYAAVGYSTYGSYETCLEYDKVLTELGDEERLVKFNDYIASSVDDIISLLNTVREPE